MKVNSVLCEEHGAGESKRRKTHNQVQNIEHNGCFDGPRTEREHSISDQKQNATEPPPLVRIIGHYFQESVENYRRCTESNRSHETRQCEQQRGNIVSDCLSQGAQGVSIPTPNVSTPAPNAANAPIKSKVLVDLFKT